MNIKGSKLRVTLNPEKEKEIVQITHDTLNTRVTTLDLFNTKINKVTHLLQNQLGRKSVLPYHRNFLIERGKYLFELYKVENLSFKDSCNNSINIFLVYANAEDILDKICDERAFGNPRLVKVMIDGGQGFLKITLSVLPPNYNPLTDSIFCENSEDSDEQAVNTDLKGNYSPFIKGKLTGVRKLVILAIVPDIPESNSNLEILFEKSGLNNISFKFVVDFKMLNSCLGLQNSTSIYPCPYCEITLNDLRALEKVLYDKNFETPKERTFGTQISKRVFWKEKGCPVLLQYSKPMSHSRR